MQLIPEHFLGFVNAWWFSLAYGILSIVIMFFFTKRTQKSNINISKI